MEEIIKSRPINRTAANVIRPGPKGLELASKQNITFEFCPEIRPLPPDAPDLIGHVQGWLTVIGLEKRTTADGASWICRCRCGYYTGRKAKSLRNPKNSDDKCNRCRNVDYLKRSAEFRRTGVNQP